MSHARSSVARRRILAPEVVQTSTMDCGPAALKCLLEAHGIPISYPRLQEACQTDLDGTSINTIEQVATALGLDAEQIMVPVDHVLLARAKALPALAVVRRQNMTHFLVAWRRHGPLVQLMDPSVALGQGSIASGFASMAFGQNANASGGYSVATGDGTTAAGAQSTAMGMESTASGEQSFAAGRNAKALGHKSIAMGADVVADGESSVAIGSGINAGGFGSVVLGTLASATAGGSFVFGDSAGDASTTVTSNASHQFLVRATGGTRFFSNVTLSAGVSLAPGGSAWASVSDVNMKEYFRDLDSDDLLAKIARMSIREWNYKAQDAAIRHVGPTAQDFHAAFGLGEDPLRISTIDADGIALAGVKALALENQALKTELAALRARLERFETDRQ